MRPRFSASIHRDPKHGFPVDAHHIHSTPGSFDDEHVLVRVHCDTYQEAEQTVAEKARRRGIRPHQIVWED